MRHWIPPGFTVAVLAGTAAAQGSPDRPFRSTAAERERMTITVYNQDFGLVREVRALSVARGRVALEFGDVASEIEAETVRIAPIGTPGAFRVLEQNYQFDLLSPQKLLEKYVGRQVRVYRANPVTGRDEVHDAEVLASHQGAILKIGGDIMFDLPGRIAFPEIPANLIARPTLVWLLESAEARQRVEVSYLTRNLGWRADYVLLLNDSDTRGDLTGWVTLTNRSGATYENAELKLVAGDVRRLPSAAPRERFEMLAQAAAREDSFREEGLFEHHLYTLQRPTTLLQNEQKQVLLLEGAGIGLTKTLVLAGAPGHYRTAVGAGTTSQRAAVVVEIANRETNRLGMALPAGVVRVYKADRSGAQQFVGEDRIDHTPRDETVRISLGTAFDVVGERRQVDYKVLSRCSAESAWEIALRNHKDGAVDVEVVEAAGGDWELLAASHTSEKLDAFTFRFRVSVPARGAATVTYRVRVKWC